MVLTRNIMTRLRTEVKVGQLRQVREEAPLSPNAPLNVGDKILIKEVTSWAHFYWPNGVIGTTTVIWLEKWTDLI